MSSSSAISSEHQSDSYYTVHGPERMKFGEIVCLVGIVAAFLVAEIHNARLRPFWYDELATLFVASQPTLGAMFRVMPSDGNPPLYFLLARLCLHLPVNTELGLRLPSVLAFPTGAVAGVRLRSSNYLISVWALVDVYAVGFRPRRTLRGRGQVLFFAAVAYAFVALFLAVCQKRPQSRVGSDGDCALYFGGDPISSIWHHLCRIADSHRRSHSLALYESDSIWEC